MHACVPACLPACRVSRSLSPCLQLLIRTIFEKAVKAIEIPGTTVVPFPLFEALDGSFVVLCDKRASSAPVFF